MISSRRVHPPRVQIAGLRHSRLPPLLSRIRRSLQSHHSIRAKLELPCQIILALHRPRQVRLQRLRQYRLQRKASCSRTKPSRRARCHPSTRLVLGNIPTHTTALLILTQRPPKAIYLPVCKVKTMAIPGFRLVSKHFALRMNANSLLAFKAQSSRPTHCQ